MGEDDYTLSWWVPQYGKKRIAVDEAEKEEEDVVRFHPGHRRQPYYQGYTYRHSNPSWKVKVRKHYYL
jgi:hypothetical protein